MGRFILISFGFMAWAFYEMSGGADFDPIAHRTATVQARMEASGQPAPWEIAEAETPEAEPEVTRASLNLSTLDEVLTEDTAQPDAPSIQPAQAGVIKASLNTSQSNETSIVLPSLIEKTPQPASVTVDDAPADICAVSGNIVNVRGGPGTSYSVVNQLDRGDEVEILQDPGNGWVELRPVAGGEAGWMADFLLTGG